MSITWIFTIISLFFCCVTAYNLIKLQKNNKLLREIKVNEIKDIAETVSRSVVHDAVCSALLKINSSKTEEYLITCSKESPQFYAIWRKFRAEDDYGIHMYHYGNGYILIKMFDSPNAEENLRNATELCSMLNEGINETM